MEKEESCRIEENMSLRVERQLEDKLEFTVERIKQCQVT